MRRSTAALTALAAITLLPQSLLAQPSGRLGVAAAIEHASITEDDGYLGAGNGGSGVFTVQLSDATAVEFEVGRVRHTRDFNSYAIAEDAQGRFQPLPYIRRWSGTATFAGVVVARTYGRARLRPVLFGGGGFMTHGGTRIGPVTLPVVPAGSTVRTDQDLGTRTGRRVTALMVDGGAGLDVHLPMNFVVRPFAGLRLASTENFGPKYIIRVGTRVGFRW